MDEVDRRVKYFMRQKNRNWVKSKFYTKVVRPAMIYVSDCQAVNKKIEQSVSVVEMSILKWINEMTREDKIRK